MAVIPDKTAFQTSLASLPVVTYQPGETVIADDSKTGRLLILKKGTVAIVKGGHRDCQGSEARRGVWRTLHPARSASHSGRACLGNLAVPRRQCDRPSRTKSGRSALRCSCAGPPTRQRESRSYPTKAPTSDWRAAQRGRQNGQQDRRTSRRQWRQPRLCRISIRSVQVVLPSKSGGDH